MVPLKRMNHLMRMIGVHIEGWGPPLSIVKSYACRGKGGLNGPSHLEEEKKKKTNFLFVFSTYLPVFLLKFRSGELVGCGIKFRIQRVPTRHTFDGPHYPKNKKYLKKHDDDT